MIKKTSFFTIFMMIMVLSCNILTYGSEQSDAAIYEIYPEEMLTDIDNLAINTLSDYFKYLTGVNSNYIEFYSSEEVRDQVFKKLDYDYRFSDQLKYNKISYLYDDKPDKYGIQFRKIENADLAILEYLTNVEIAKDLSLHLSAENPSITSNNITSWILNNIHYITEEEKLGKKMEHRRPYGNVFTDNYGTCINFSLAFHQLCKMNKIPSTLVTVNYIKSDSSILHMINTVTLNNTNYWIDPQIGKLYSILPEIYFEIK